MLYHLPLAVLVAKALFAFASAAIIDTTLPPGVTSSNCVNYPVFSRCWSDTKNHVDACGEDKSCQCLQANYFLICFLQCESPGQPASQVLAPYQAGILASLKPQCAALTSSIKNSLNGNNNNGQVNSATSVAISSGTSVVTPAVSTVNNIAATSLPLNATSASSLLTMMTPIPMTTMPLNSTTSTMSHIQTLPTTNSSNDASAIYEPSSMFMSSFFAIVTYILQALAMV